MQHVVFKCRLCFACRGSSRGEEIGGGDDGEAAAAATAATAATAAADGEDDDDGDEREVSGDDG